MKIFNSSSPVKSFCFLSAVLIFNFGMAQTNYVANTANSVTPGSNNVLVGAGVGNAGMNGTLNAFFGDDAGHTNTTRTRKQIERLGHPYFRIRQTSIL